MIGRLGRSVVEFDEGAAKEAAEEILRAGVDPLRAIEEGISPAARIVGEKFEKGEYFLPHLLLAAEAVKAASDILTAELRMKDRLEMEARRLGDVVIATVSGDIHDIGKNIVALLLSVNGFRVHDLGRDAESMAIVQRAIDVEADIIALSALMSTTMPSQREVIEILRAMGVRERFVVMVGGGSTTREWAEEIGADGWAETAEKAVELAQNLIRGRG